MVLLRLIKEMVGYRRRVYMDYEKLWYELKQWVIENNEKEMLIQMSNFEIKEVTNFNNNYEEVDSLG